MTLNQAACLKVYKPYKFDPDSEIGKVQLPLWDGFFIHLKYTNPIRWPWPWKMEKFSCSYEMVSLFIIERYWLWALMSLNQASCLNLCCKILNLERMLYDPKENYKKLYWWNSQIAAMNLYCGVNFFGFE